MNEGRCLCASVRWKLLAVPYAIYNCHCRMCQKVHGAAFGNYCFVKPSEIEWLSDTKTIVRYASSEVMVRSSCDICGSVVPYADRSDDFWVVPGGCHDEMRKPDGNIFVADNSPWHSISGNLPASDGYPEESDLYESDLYGVGLPPLDSPGATVRDSCLCGDITFQITEPFKVAHNCHCSRCRYGRATAHASNGFVSSDGLQYLTGEDRLRSYKVPEAKFFTQVFCATCSSLMPRRDIDRGICVVPLGSLDDDAGVKPVDHIFIGNKASWHDITDGLPQFQEGPL